MFSQRNWMPWALACFIACSVPSQASGISAAMRLEDKRLETPVTLTEKRICIGDLLERLSKLSGIPIQMNPRDPASGIRITIGCTNAPIVDVLNALWRLPSSREAEWTWTRNGKAGSYDYVLSPWIRAADRAERLRNYAQTALENYVDLMIQFAYLSPEERLRNKHRLTVALNQKDDAVAASLVGQDNMWDCVRMFAETVPPELRLPVVRGQQEARVSVRDLLPETQELIHTVWKHFNVIINGEAAPEPEVLRFYANAPTAIRPEVVSAIWLDLGAGNGSISILGGYFLEDGVRAAIKSLWLLPGDVATSSESQRPVAAVKEAISSPWPGPEPFMLPDGVMTTPTVPYAVDLRLDQLAQGAALTVLGMFPGDSDRDPGDPGRHMVQDFLDRLKKSSLYPMYKWYGNTLLITYPAWFMEDNEEHAVPYEIIKRHLGSKDGLISLPDLVNLFSSIDTEQLRYLAQDYSFVPPAAGLLPVCALYARYPEIISPNGMHLDQEQITALKAYQQFQNCASLVDGTAVALRLAESDTVVSGHKRLDIRAEVLDANGRWGPLYEFVQRADRVRNSR